MTRNIVTQRSRPARLRQTRIKIGSEHGQYSRQTIKGSIVIDQSLIQIERLWRKTPQVCDRSARILSRRPRLRPLVSPRYDHG